MNKLPAKQNKLTESENMTEILPTSVGQGSPWIQREMDALRVGYAFAGLTCRGVG